MSGLQNSEYFKVLLAVPIKKSLMLKRIPGITLEKNVHK